MVQNILFTFVAYMYAKLKRLTLNFFQTYTVQLRKLSTFLTCISVLKPVNPCSCVGRAINDFGKLFSARPYKVTLETKIFGFHRRSTSIVNCCVFFTPLPLTLLQSTSLAAVLNFDGIQSTYSWHSRSFAASCQHNSMNSFCSTFYDFTDVSQAIVTGTGCIHE